MISDYFNIKARNFVYMGERDTDVCF